MSFGVTRSVLFWILPDDCLDELLDRVRCSEAVEQLSGNSGLGAGDRRDGSASPANVG